MEASYSSLLKRLLSVNMTGGMKLGLENTLALSRALGDPHKAFRSIHVAGTNGKGSVATKIAAALQSAGYRVGLNTSPHISCFRERVRINGTMISENEAARLLAQTFAAVDTQTIPATFFEITTLLAMAYFAEQAVDIAVIETGIGGRLDATNIIRPDLSVITSISLEHTDMLGDTIDAITQEKAGIIKAGIPVVIGPNVPGAIIQSVADRLHSPCIAVQGKFEDYHAENNAIAQKSLEQLRIPKEHIIRGLQAVPPCRTEIVDLHGKTIILDAAHNVEGFNRLMNLLNTRYPNKPKRFIFGLSSNKDIAGCLNTIKDCGVHFHLVKSDSSRALSNEVLRDSLLALGTSSHKITCESSIANAIGAALAHDDLIIVCGTFFIMKEARRALGYIEEQDPFNLNECIDRNKKP